MPCDQLVRGLDGVPVAGDTARVARRIDGDGRRTGTARAVDGHRGPVPPEAWHADEIARERGRVEMFNATRPGGRDGWTMDVRQYELMRAHILEMVDEHAADGSVALRDVVAAAQERYAAHELFPKGRVRNYCTFAEVDLEARCEIERVPGASPQRIRRFSDV